MDKISDIKELENVLSSKASLLYITAPNCNVCDALKIKIKELFSKDFPKIELFEIDSSKVPQIAGRFNIFSAPTILIFFEGKEFCREGRNVSISHLKEKIKKIYDLYFG